MESAPITNTGGGSNISQVSQLDWVALSRSTASFSLEVLARLHNAGVEPITICMGKTLCSSIILPLEAQIRVNDSLSKLKSCSAYGKFLWFGFGIKHIINSLADTEQGVACVAICAGLAVSYTNFFAAKTLRELCILRGTPEILRPSLRQWSALVDVCAGSLTASQFPVVLDGFARLLAPSNNVRAATDPAVLAQGLAVLVDIARGAMSTATFVGGLDCAWLAAIAQFLLCLSIEIVSASGMCLHQSSFTPSGQSIQVTFIREESGTGIATQITLKTYQIASGRKLLNMMTLLEGSSIRGPGSWSTILEDTFGPLIESFFKPPLDGNLHQLLQCTARILERLHSVPGEKRLLNLKEMRWANPTWFAIPPRPGEDFLVYSAEILPELKTVLEIKSMVFTDACGSIPDLIDLGNEAVAQIQKACRCHSCQVGHIWGHSTCFVGLARTIVRYILYLSPVVIEKGLLPSATALRALYQSISKGAFQDIADLALGGELPTVLFLLTGRRTYMTHSPITSSFSAISGGGVCVFYQALESIDAPPTELLMIRAIPGHIEWQGHFYGLLADLHGPEESKNNSNDRLQTQPRLSSRLSKCQLRLVAEEDVASEILKVAYELYADGPEAPNTRYCMEIGRLVASIRAIIRTNTSQQSCSQNFTITNNDLSPSKGGQSWAISLDQGVNQCADLQQWSIVEWSSIDLHHQRVMEIEATQPRCYAELYYRAYQPQDIFYARTNNCILVQTGNCIQCIARIAATTQFREQDSESTNHSKVVSGLGRVVLFDSDGTKEVAFLAQRILTKSRWSLTQYAKSITGSGRGASRH